MKWYQNFQQIVAFGKILEALTIIEDIDDVWTYLENPKQYDEIYATWVSYGQPQPDEPGEAAEWEEFQSQIEITEEEE